METNKMSRKYVIRVKVFDGTCSNKSYVEHDFNKWMTKYRCDGEEPKIDIINTHVNMDDNDYVITVFYKKYLEEKN